MRLLIVVALLSCGRLAPQQDESTGPPGSHLVCGANHVYFEHAVDGGWERIGVVGAKRYGPAKGAWYFQAEAGPIRILVDP